VMTPPRSPITASMPGTFGCMAPGTNIIHFNFHKQIDWLKYIIMDITFVRLSIMLKKFGAIVFLPLLSKFCQKYCVLASFINCVQIIAKILSKLSKILCYVNFYKNFKHLGPVWNSHKINLKHVSCASQNMSRGIFIYSSHI
jgi:hypothetical protein